MKLMFLGDIHGSIDHMVNISDIAKYEKIDKIIQVGDMGFWEHEAGGVAFLDSLRDILPCPLYFIDGNHDNHPLLWSKYEKHGHLSTVRHNIFYIHRGAVWVWNDVSFLAMGGAFSIDLEWRQKLYESRGIESWWSTELITDDDVDVALKSAANLPPDIMLTHDAPDGCPMHKLSGIQNLRKDLEERSASNRAKVGFLARQTHPKAIIHGHYHNRVNYTMSYGSHPDIHCVSLGCEPQGLDGTTKEDSYIVCDLEVVRQDLDAIKHTIG